MSKKIQRRRGTTAEHAIFTGAQGEITIDTDKKAVVVHDGTTPGGFPQVTAAELADAADLAKGAGMVGFLQAGAGATARTALDKLREVVSVKDFGAVGDGVTDDTVAITRAFQYASAIGATLLGDHGSYLVSDIVTWMVTKSFRIDCEPGFEIIASASFPSTKALISPAFPASGAHQFIWVGGKIDARNMPPLVSGYAADVLTIASPYLDFVHVDGVTLISNDSRAGTAADSLLFIAQAEDIFVTNNIFQGAKDAGVYISADASGAYGRRARVRGNTFIQCAASFISKRAFEDQVISGNFFVDCDFGPVVGGSADTTLYPGKKAVITGNILRGCMNGITASISDGTSISGNRIENYGADSSGAMVAAYAIQVYGSKYCDVSGNIVLSPDLTQVSGSSAIKLSRTTLNSINYDSTDCVIDGNVIAGARIGINETAFCNRNIIGSANKFTGCATNVAVSGSSSVFGVYLEGANPRVVLNSQGTGDSALADGTVSCTAGSGANNSGGVNITTGTVRLISSASTDVYTLLRPATDGTVPLGQSARRFSQLYAATATINTSDEREKQHIRELSEAERATAIRLKSLIRAFYFNDAVAEKGDGARIHVGVIAQDVKAAFEAEGLVAEDYAILCYDEWKEQQEIKDEDGNIIQEYRAAGNRYGVRYEELLAFIISAL